MTSGRGRRGSVPLAVVLVASVAGSLGLALAERSEAGTRAVAAAAGCDAAEALAPDARVAIVDSGIDRSALAPGAVVGERVDLTDGSGGGLDRHGTEMASIVVAGAPGARLLDIRVLDGAGAGSVAAMAQGIDAAVRADADVVNLSAAVPASAPAVRAAVDRAVARGAVVVLAAGNESRDLDRDPAWRALAADPCVVVVGATGRDGGHLPSSNHGAVVEAWAPGEAVAAIGLAGRPVAATGTSPAAAATTADLVGG